MKKISVVIFSIIVLIGCNKENLFDGPNFFQDDFESYSSLGDMLLPDDKIWSFTQLTRGENQITVDTSNAHSGLKSLKFVANKTDNEGASKSSISKQNMAF